MNPAGFSPSLLYVPHKIFFFHIYAFPILRHIWGHYTKRLWDNLVFKIIPQPLINQIIFETA